MNLPRSLFLSALVLASTTGWGADDLGRILSVMDRRVAFQCELRRLLSQHEKARTPAEQGDLQKRMADVNQRAEGLERGLQGWNPEAAARTLPHSEQVKIRDHVAILVQRCNATLPQQARLPVL